MSELVCCYVVVFFSTRETRLTEAVDNICEGILQYSVHAERPGSLRYAKVVWLVIVTSNTRLSTVLTFVYTDGTKKKTLQIGFYVQYYMSAV